MSTKVRFEENKFKIIGVVAALAKAMGSKQFHIHDSSSKEDKLSKCKFYLARLDTSGAYMLCKKAEGENEYQFVEILRRTEDKEASPAMISHAVKHIDGIDTASTVYISITRKEENRCRHQGLEMIWFFVPVVAGSEQTTEPVAA